MAERRGTAPPGAARAASDTGLIVVDVQEAFRPVIDRFDQVVAQLRHARRGLRRARPAGAGERAVPQGPRATPCPSWPSGCPRARAWSRSCASRPAASSAFDEAIAESRLRRAGSSPASRRTSASTRPSTTCCRSASRCRSRPTRSRRARRPTATLGSSQDGRRRRRTTSAEMALFEMLEEAGSDEFKAISRLVR